MEGFFVAMPAVLLILACPLMMIVPGIGAWLWARARGQKRALSIGCMPGHGAEPASASPALEAEMAALRQQVGALQSQLKTNGRVDTTVEVPS